MKTQLLRPCRSLFGASWGHVGAMLGPSWGHVGAMVGCACWLVLQKIFGPIFGGFGGPMLEPCWKPRRLEIGKKAIWSRFCRAFKMEADLEMISGRFARRLERQKRAKVWEGLQNFNAGLSQHNIHLGSVWGRILGRFGVLRRPSKSIPNRLKFDLGRPWRPQCRPRAPQEAPRSSQDLPKPPNRPKHRLQIGQTIMQTLKATASLNRCFSRVKGHGSRAQGQGSRITCP